MEVQTFVALEFEFKAIVADFLFRHNASRPCSTNGLKNSRQDSDAPSPSGSTQTLGSESSKAAAAAAAGPATQVSEDDTKRAIELVHNSSTDKAKEKPKSRLRDKLWFKGKPQEAQRNEDKRRSIN